MDDLLERTAELKLRRDDTNKAKSTGLVAVSVEPDT